MLFFCLVELSACVHIVLLCSPGSQLSAVKLSSDNLEEEVTVLQSKLNLLQEEQGIQAVTCLDGGLSRKCISTVRIADLRAP